MRQREQINVHVAFVLTKTRLASKNILITNPTGSLFLTQSLSLAHMYRVYQRLVQMCLVHVSLMQSNIFFLALLLNLRVQRRIDGVEKNRRHDLCMKIHFIVTCTLGELIEAKKPNKIKRLKEMCCSFGYSVELRRSEDSCSSPYP